jgi:polyhydroxybutyrate depolymerase
MRYLCSLAVTRLLALMALPFALACGACGKGQAVSGPTDPTGGAGGSSGGGVGPGGACDLTAAATGDLPNQRLLVGGTSRAFALSIPGTSDGKKALPVIFVFHGDGGTGISARSYFGFEAKHGNEAIFVYPDGTGQTWNLDTWDAASNPDVQFIDAIRADLAKRYCISSFYATGFSRGGFFANHLGCHRGDVFRAIAGHGAGGPYDGSGTHFDAQGNLVCPTKPVPTLLVVGSNDDLLNDAVVSRKYWGFANSCQGEATATAPSPCVTYAGCSKTLEWCQIPGLGHAVWPNAADTTWDFFKQN